MNSDFLELMNFIRQIDSTSKYLGMNVSISSNKEDKINSRRTKLKSELSEDHRRRNKQNRNEKCNCGSGLKFKKCCGKIINKEEQ